MPRRVVVSLVLLITTGCASPGLPELPDGADPALQVGRDVFEARCRSCHGSDGGGGSGPGLRGIEERYPDIASQIAVVAEGRGAMPAWDEALTAEEIEAVVRFTREVL